MVYEFSEHPSKIGERIYRGEKLPLTIRDYRRLAKWARRTNIIVKNHSTDPKYHVDPRRLDLMELGLPGGEDSDIDPEDNLGPLIKMAMGVPAKELMEENILILKEQLGLIKTT